MCSPLQTTIPIAKPSSNLPGNTKRPQRPYASFYIGVLGGLLHTKSWVDLRYLDDFDGIEFNRRLGGGRIHPVTSLSQEVLVRLLDCVAGAEDTTRLQERAIRDELARLR